MDNQEAAAQDTNYKHKTLGSVMDLISLYWNAMLNAFAGNHHPITTPSANSSPFKAIGQCLPRSTPSKNMSKKTKKGLGKVYLLPASLQSHEDY